MAKKLTPEQIEDAARLKRIYELKKAADRTITQESLAAECGWKTQSAVTQYVNGLVPLNLDALIKFSLALKVPIEEISPMLASKIHAVRVKPDSTGASREAMEIARAFDRLADPTHRNAVIAMLRSWGVMK